MKRTSFTLLLEVDGVDQEHTVDVLNVDRLQAEVSGRQNGLLVSLEEAPMTWTTHWLWHACRRVGVFGGDWREFKTALIDFEDAAQGSDVPPTNEAEHMSFASS